MSMVSGRGRARAKEGEGKESKGTREGFKPEERSENLLCMHFTMTCCLKFCSQQEHRRSF